ncbi:hypothetical protein [Streptomyces echinatus]
MLGLLLRTHRPARLEQLRRLSCFLDDKGRSPRHIARLVAHTIAP